MYELELSTRDAVVEPAATIVRSDRVGYSWIESGILRVAVGLIRQTIPAFVCRDTESTDMVACTKRSLASVAACLGSSRTLPFTSCDRSE